MEGLFETLALIDEAINTKSRRHLAGGILLSMSLLLGGMAFTILTIKIDKDEEREAVYEQY